MKKEYTKPGITANAYALFEDVLTWGCTKQFDPPQDPLCEGGEHLDPPGHGSPNTGQSDFCGKPGYATAPVIES